MHRRRRSRFALFLGQRARKLSGWSITIAVCSTLLRQHREGSTRQSEHCRVTTRGRNVGAHALPSAIPVMYPLALPYGAVFGLPVNRSAGFCERAHMIQQPSCRSNAAALCAAVRFNYLLPAKTPPLATTSEGVQGMTCQQIPFTDHSRRKPAPTASHPELAVWPLNTHTQVKQATATLDRAGKGIYAMQGNV